MERTARSEATVAIPSPRATYVSRLRIGGETVTAIARVWDRADVGRCRLCDACNIDRLTGLCLVQTTEDVPPGSAAWWSTRGREVVGDDVRPALRVFGDGPG